LNPDEKVVGERIAYDSRIADSKSISGEVKKLGRRIRSNSTTEKQNVLETHENTKTLTRSFLRTWVRVVKI
ncbi:MAG TPA: hypothetical protein VL947_10090, partial [Cytophagales bacterium]|nr:hypothetical protein [Cytophagales bacterium]